MTNCTIPIKIGDSLYHPCSMDIIEHKVTSILQFEGFKHYVCKAVHNVGACGRIEVILDESKNKLRFRELIDEERIEYASGLGDFIEGEYFRTLQEARLEFYKVQKTLASSHMDRTEKIYQQAKQRYEQVELLVKTITQELNGEN